MHTNLLDCSDGVFIKSFSVDFANSGEGPNFGTSAYCRKSLRRHIFHNRLKSGWKTRDSTDFIPKHRAPTASISDKLKKLWPLVSWAKVVLWLWRPYSTLFAVILWYSRIEDYPWNKITKIILYVIFRGKRDSSAPQSGGWPKWPD